MKKILCIAGAIFTMILTSCASLQEDIFVSSTQKFQFYQSIQNFEEEYASIDANYWLTGMYSEQDVNNLIIEINQYSQEKHTEPAIKARLCAVEGLLYQISSKTAKAKTFYSTARKAQAGDSYVQLLGVMLEKDDEARLNKIEQNLKIDEKNAVLLLGKAKLLYRMKKYNEAAATIGNAFVIFEQNENKYIIETYSEFKTQIWEMYTINKDSQNKIDAATLQGKLTLNSMIEFTESNSSLLTFITGGRKMKTSDIIKKLEAYGYLSSSYDTSNTAKSSSDITKASNLNRILCARFIWNLFVNKKGNDSLRTKYSSRFLRLSNPVSPIPDVPLNHKDFDAVLGTVENEIMDLPDGKNFKPEQDVSSLDFIKWIQAAEK